MAAAAALRLWDLDAKALHHDETLHATFSWSLYDGRGYPHAPLMHGPFQFNMNALSFFLFGVTDFTARLPHALFGTALVGMPYLLRRQIGAKAALIPAALLAVSPTLLYFGRFDREDIYAAFWTLAIVVCLWRYLDGQRPTWLAGLAPALAFAFAAEERTYLAGAPPAPSACRPSATSSSSSARSRRPSSPAASRPSPSTTTRATPPPPSTTCATLPSSPSCSRAPTSASSGAGSSGCWPPPPSTCPMSSSSRLSSPTRTAS